jgi:hypothetical protein
LAEDSDWEAADNLRFHHAMSSKAKLRSFVIYKANSWKRPRKVVARLECSLQPGRGRDRHAPGGRHPENLIKLHKAQLASDRMSCHSATANQVRLILHTAAFWLMHDVRAAIPQANPLAK